MSQYPDIFDLRNWDFTLLKRYKSVFSKPNKTCHLCAMGPCRPTKSPYPTINPPASPVNPLLPMGTDFKSVPKKGGVGGFFKEGKEEGFTNGGQGGIYGKCGIDETGFKAREALLDAVIGAACHTSHAMRLLMDLIGKFGADCPLDAGPHTITPTPITTLITGCTPKNIGEFKDILTYIEGQLTHLLSSISFGTEASPEDFVSKMLHAGMLDNLALEVADVAQISAMNTPKGESNSPLVTIGLETIDTSKPVILIIGHNSTVAHEIMHLLEKDGMRGTIEVCGLCCAAADSARHSHNFKIIGNQASQIDVIKSGIADVVILDTQCIRADVVEEARKVDSIIIATTQETALGLKDLTGKSPDEASEYITRNGTGIILDKKKAAETALNIAVWSRAKKSPQPPFIKGGQRGDSGFLRIGRGPIRDSEIRGVAPSIVMGEIPGIIGIFGCPEENQKTEDRGQKPEESVHQKLAEEFLSRGYIVSTGGCASMDVARGNLFKDSPDSFDSRNLTNLGSCVSASHLIGACIKIAQIMCHRKLENNYQEIADYIINRVGATVILWGGFTQKAFSSALGMARLGIPVIFGPRFKNYGLYLLGQDGEWQVKDQRIGDIVQTGPAPQNLLCFAETIEDVLPLAAKLCMRPNDTTEGRKIKLKNYIEFYKKTAGRIPHDIHLFIRTHYDIPEEAPEINQILEKKNWQPTFIPDPTILC